MFFEEDPELESVVYECQVHSGTEIRNRSDNHNLSSSPSCVDQPKI